MVHEVESKKTEEQKEDTVANIMTEQYFNQELVLVARTVTFKPLSETSVLVATNAKGIVQIDAFTQFEQSYPSKVSHSVMDVSPRKPFFILAVNTSTSVIRFTENQRVAKTSPPPSEKIHIKNNEYSPYIPQSSTVNSVSVVHYKKKLPAVS